MNTPDYIFETSWEICNKVGGIYTVLSTKALTVVKSYRNNYICIGPDLSKDNNGNKDFIEDPGLFNNWREIAQNEGLRIRIGRWNVCGNPITILVDFTPFYEKKNDILTQFWLKYKLDSISGQWDYVEPALFGYAAGRVIESFYQYHCNAMDKIVAHFHEWMTGTGILHLESACPQIATVFTTHATVLGRCIAGNGLPLYSDINRYNPQETANRFGVQSKFSLEYLSAQVADAFTTVSCITNKECEAFFKKSADTITINGFENTFVPQGDDFIEKRKIARTKLIEVASSLTQQPVSEDALLVINSGRYEFRNKGIDIFIDGLSKLVDNNNLKREVVAFIAVPAGTTGKRIDLVEKMQKPLSDIPVLHDYVTHLLYDSVNDPIVATLKRVGLDNAPEKKVKVIFVPVYLNGNDGIFNLDYYDLLIGFDLSVFPSYYEPWGYTPLESVAFGIPTITTSLAGFGLWAYDNFGVQKGAWMIERTDFNQNDVSSEIANAIAYYADCNPQTKAEHDRLATEIACKALWDNLYNNYLEAYHKAIQKSNARIALYQNKTSKIGLLVDKIQRIEPQWRRISVKSNLPDSLKKLEKLANNLWWSWNFEARELFEEIAGPDLWKEYGENPVHVLQILPLERINKFHENTAFYEKLDRIYRQFETYINTPVSRPEKKVAYFSMEFGISNELKIFSGGLGMLAGDYLKEASDCNVNMIGIGLLYRYGYFTQQISALGDQLNLYPAQSFSKLPIIPLKDEKGDWITISLALPGRKLFARIWRVNVGRIPLYLLDTDFNENSEEDRRTTSTLYGGDIENRLKQEFLLGIGGIRLLRTIGENPTLYHLNEGHAAFSNLERLRLIINENHISLSAAVELVRASSLYTTHTPVPAGHDAFSEDLMRKYFSYFPESNNISWQTFMGFGRKHTDYVNDKFSMSILACKLCQEVNGVSKIHGRVSREMFEDLYEGHFANELHIGYVTNGVHYPTWTHKKWQLFHREVFGDGFVNDRSNPSYWEKIYEVENKRIWTIKDSLRAEMLDNVKKLLAEQMRRRNESPELIVSTLKSIRNDVLTIGFARRFATYKRAHLLFTNERKLYELLNNKEHPIQFIFAGKAHPNDKAGQDLIKRIIDFSRKSEYIGKIIFVENYDMILAKKLVSGCDVWLNTPTRPLEASGTSGEKAVMNGVLNFSVLDGWWAEGYVPNAGWALNEQITYSDNRLQDELDAATLYSTFDEQIAPAFYDRNSDNVPEKWVEMMKNCFAKISPHYTMKRQLDDYYNLFYHKLEKRSELLNDNNKENMFKLIKWKEKILTAWDTIELVAINAPSKLENNFFLGEHVVVRLQLKIGYLDPDDLKIEFVFVNRDGNKTNLFKKFLFKFVSTENDVTTYECAIDTEYTGVWNCAFRIIPSNPLLPHDMDFNLVKWI